jgi:hypothetical protein
MKNHEEEQKAAEAFAALENTAPPCYNQGGGKTLNQDMQFSCDGCELYTACINGQRKKAEQPECYGNRIAPKFSSDRCHNCSFAQACQMATDRKV